MMKRKKIHWWIDNLNLQGVFHIWSESHKNKYDIAGVSFFGKESFCGKVFVRQLCKGAIKKLFYDLSVHDQDNQEALFWHVWRESNEFGIKAAQTLVSQDFLADKLASTCSRERWRLYFEREICYEQKRNLSIVRLTHWHILKNCAEVADINAVCLDGKLWHDSLKSYTKKFGVELYTFNRKNWALWAWIRYGYCYSQYLKFALFSLLNKQLDLRDKDIDSPKIGVFYAQGADLEQRSDLFWLPESGINPREVLVYFMSSQKPPTPERVASVEKQNVQWFSLLSYKKGYTRNNINRQARYFKAQAHCLWENFIQFSKLFEFLGGKHYLLKFWQMERLLWLLHRVAIFKALIQSQNIKVHFGLFSEDDQNMIALHLAIEQLQAVDVYVHWSNHPEAQIFPSHDVYFTWGPYYKNFYERFHHGIHHLLYSGYPFDYAIQRFEDSARKYRQQFAANGVNFVLCFFDNSYWEGGWFSKESLVQAYESILREVKTNPGWGIILKPKREDSLQFAMVQKIADLINLLKKEGRCIVMDKRQIPALAAQASDLTIGFGTFSTPSVESALSGMATVIYDPSFQKTHPFYKWGFEKIIFYDIHQLLERIRRFAGDRTSYHGFGDYSFVLSEIDPFQDGRAFQRIGGYMKVLLESLCAGVQKDKAIHLANDSYQQHVGPTDIHACRYTAIAGGEDSERIL